MPHSSCTTCVPTEQYIIVGQCNQWRRPDWHFFPLCTEQAYRTSISSEAARRVSIAVDKKYVLSNSESVQCNFFIWIEQAQSGVHPVQNLLLCTKFHQNRMIFHWDMAIYRFSKWRPSAILELFYHYTRPPTIEVSVAGRSCLSNFMSIWYTDLKI